MHRALVPNARHLRLRSGDVLQKLRVRIERFVVAKDGHPNAFDLFHIDIDVRILFHSGAFDPPERR